jgi:hypothetical protein
MEIQEKRGFSFFKTGVMCDRIAEYFKQSMVEFKR